MEFLFKIGDIRKNEENCALCPFWINEELRRRKPLIIPYNEPLKLMIISRDPPMDFLLWYAYSIDNYDPEVARKVLFASAIPYKFLYVIRRFSIKHLNELGWKEDELVSNILLIQKLFESAYWTHYHKCPTGEGDGSSYKNSKCADAFLDKEFKWANDNGVQRVIALSGAVHQWIDKNDVGFNKTNIIKFPHPSGANNGEWYTSDEAKIRALASSINLLVYLAKS